MPDTVHTGMCFSLLYVLSMQIENTNCDKAYRIFPLGDILFDTFAVA